MGCINLELANPTEVQVTSLITYFTIDSGILDSSLLIETQSPPAFEVTNLTSSALVELKQEPPIYISPQDSVAVGITSVTSGKTDITTVCPPKIELTIYSQPVNAIIEASCQVTAQLPMPDYFFYTAAEDIEAYKVVYVENEEYARVATFLSSELAYLAVKGISVADAYTGSRSRVQSTGELYKADWNWLPELPLFLEEDGSLTQTAPDVKVILQVAIALTPKTILIDIEEPVLID
jgi:hypothetical protein